jgi:hypothetical protein
MNTKTTLLLFSLIVSFAVSQTARAQTSSADSNGLYYVSSGEKAEIQILKAHVYSENNMNSDFRVSLDTSDYPDDAKHLAVVLRIGNFSYAWSGGGGQPGKFSEMEFKIHSQDEAEIAAKWLGVDCAVRMPPGYKYSVQFIPTRSEFQTNEPVLVKFVMKNLDERTIIFPDWVIQQDFRNFQYGFQAESNYKPVADTGDPKHTYGSMNKIVNLEPGKTFDDQIDLKNWFSFDTAGTYDIHGFYSLNFQQDSKNADIGTPWTIMWSDYASADFKIVIK